MKKFKNFSKLFMITTLGLSIAASGMAEIPLAGNQGSVAEAATGLNMNGLTISCYPYSNENIPVYNVTSSNKTRIGTCYGSVDLISILGVGTDGWSAITYPLTNGGTKSGYCKTSYLFANPDFGGSSGLVRNNITVYQKSSCVTKFGTTTVNDRVFVLGYSSNGNTQILYPVSGKSYYKAGFIRGKYTISGDKLVAVNESDSSSNTANTKPVISNVRITNVSSEGYTVTCTVSSNVTKVKMPTWTSNAGQDDLVWHEANLSGTTASFTVRTSAHNNETGLYNTDIYAYNQNNDYVCSCSRNISVPANNNNNNQISYAAYTGVNYSNSGVSTQRIRALDKAKQMTTILWTAPATFPAWQSASGSYNSVRAVDGTVSTNYIAGKKYQGIPYSMANHSYDDAAWASLVKSGFSSGSMSTVYGSRKKTTAKGIDCSYFTYCCFASAGTGYGISYQSTASMLNSRYYSQKTLSSIRPADIALKNGHVMLYVGRSGSRYAFFEATASGSKCAYNTYTAAYLNNQGYKIYKFNGFSD